MLQHDWLRAFRMVPRRVRVSRRMSGEYGRWSVRRRMRTIELLEARTLLASASLTGGILSINDPSGLNDALVITSNASLITIVDASNSMTGGAGITSVNANTLTVPKASVTGGISITTNNGDDRVTLGTTGINVTLNGGAGSDEFIVKQGTTGTLNYDGASGTDSIVNRLGAGTAPTLTSVETNVDRPLLFIPGFGGTQAADLTPSGFQNWMLNRGQAPSALTLDPIANAYSDIAVTLDNIGYRTDSTLFPVKWDWRVPVATSTFDGTNDGLLSNVTEASMLTQQTTPTWNSGVNYFAWYLGQASNAWNTLTGTLPAKVDVVTHSTGGLIARSFLQSAGYVQSDASLDTLPEINTLIQVGVPSQGSGQLYDLLNNDFSLKTASRALGVVMTKAYNAVLGGATITGPDGSSITLASISGAADPAKEFIRRYVSTMRDLLSTDEFLDDTEDGISQFRQFTAAEGGNSLLFDLNAGTAQTSFGSKLSNAFIVYGKEASTPEFATTHTGLDFSQGKQNVQAPLGAVLGRLPTDDEVWTSYTDSPGDGTVTYESSAAPYVGNAKFQLIEITQADAGSATPIEHTDLTHDLYSQKRIVSALTGRSVGAIPNTDISTNLLRTTGQQVALLVSSGIVNPMELAASAMPEVQKFVGDIRDEMSSALDKELPVLKTSINDLLNDPLQGLQFNVFNSFATTLQNLASAPDLEVLEQRVEQQAGFDPSQFDITFVNGVLGLAFNFNITRAATKTIDFGQSNFGLTGNVTLGGEVKLDADFKLTLDVGGYLDAGNDASGADFLSITLNKFQTGVTLGATNINVGLTMGPLGGVSVQNGTATISGLLNIAFDDVDKTLSLSELQALNSFSDVIDFAPAIPLDINLPIVTSSGLAVKTIDIHNDNLLGTDPTLPQLTIDTNYIVNDAESLTYPGHIVFTSNAKVLGDGVGGADSLTINAGGAVSFGADVGGAGMANLTVTSGVDIAVAANKTISLPGGNVDFVVTAKSGGEIELGAGAKIITRQTAGTNPLTDASTGNSGHVSFAANDIDLQTGSQVLAHVLPTDTKSAGYVSFTALNDAASSAAVFGIVFSDRKSGITLNNATVQGGDVTLTAGALNIEKEGAVPAFANYFTGPIAQLMQGLPNLSLESFIGVSASRRR